MGKKLESTGKVCSGHEMGSSSIHSMCWPFLQSGEKRIAMLGLSHRDVACNYLPPLMAIAELSVKSIVGHLHYPCLSFPINKINR